MAVQALVGHQYGAASLPSRVEVSEYQLLLHEGQKAGIRTQEVERKYQRDENSVPTSYCLSTPSRHTSAVQVHHFCLFAATVNNLQSCSRVLTRGNSFPSNVSFLFVFFKSNVSVQCFRQVSLSSFCTAGRGRGGQDEGQRRRAGEGVSDRCECVC